MANDRTDVSGSCLCKAVTYRATSVSKDIVECHCSQCRKQSGHRYASVLTNINDVSIDGEQAISWFSASVDARRGFCATCGSHLFWCSTSNDDMAILAASIDDASALRLASHIFVRDKGCYYEISDAIAQFDGYDTPVPK